MSLPPYPLEQIALIKKKRLDEAEKILKEKKELLVKEEQTLQKLEEDKQKTIDHKEEKITQKNEMYVEGTTSPKLDAMNKYLDVVEKELIQKNNKVIAQEKVVKTAVEAVELARQELIKKQNDVEKLVLHRASWEKEMKKELAKQENIEMNELGSAVHYMRNKKKT